MSKNINMVVIKEFKETFSVQTPKTINASLKAQLADPMVAQVMLTVNEPMAIHTTDYTRDAAWIWGVQRHTTPIGETWVPGKFDIGESWKRHAR